MNDFEECGGERNYCMMANSNPEFNLPEFVEYDPTPYDGGYDIADTYGKPLQPSDAICYPRSISGQISKPLDTISNGSIPSPHGKEEEDNSIKPSNGSKPAEVAHEEEKKSHDGNENSFNEPYSGYGDYRGDDIFSFGSGAYDNGYGHDCGYNPWPCFSDRKGGESNGYDYGRQEPQPPFSCPPDDLELCASLFGYWPCLYKNAQKSHGQQVPEEHNCRNRWKGTADYLFGSPYPYGGKRDEGITYGNPNYAYERHHREQPLYIKHEDVESLWVQNLSYDGAYDGNPNYAYERHHQEQPLYIENEDVESLWVPNLSYDGDYDGNPNYAYERHHQEQHLYIEHEVVESMWVQNLSYNGAYDENPNYSYEMHRQEQPLFIEHEDVESLWVQNLSYDEVTYPSSKYGEHSSEESGEHFPFYQSNYYDYDE